MSAIINLYPEMNKQIADLLLGCEDNGMMLYAGTYIKELERQLAECQRKDVPEINIDYVRKMDAKELSKFITESCDCSKCPVECFSNEECESNIERWLLAKR